MRVDVIKELPASASIEASWREIYEADPEANFFLSWTWISGWIQHARRKGFILLGLRPDATASRYVALFPLRYRRAQTPSGGTARELAMAGNRGSDYTGFLAHPDYREVAAAAFAFAIKRHLEWDSVHLENVVLASTGLHPFLRAFPRDEFELQRIRVRNAIDDVDMQVSPCITLPRDWDGYLAGCLGRNTRRKARRYLERYEERPDLVVTDVCEHTVDRDLDILCTLWRAKWQERKKDDTDMLVAGSRRMLAHCFEHGRLFLRVCWVGDAPAAVIAGFTDQAKHSLLFFIGARAPEHTDPPPGYLLHLLTIRQAIAAGITTYDLLRGNEPYKYLLGGQDRQLGYFRISRR